MELSSLADTTALHAAACTGAAAFLALYWKGLPFAYHVRTSWLVISGLVKARRPASVTDPMEYQERVLLSDMDYNMHANNTFYPLLGDHVRTKLFLPMYGGLAAFRRMPVYNAGVSTLFLREFRFLDPVVVRARVVSWEARKWMFVSIEYTHGKTGQLHALALTKMCFKEGRKTVAPADAFRRLGFTDVPVDLINEISSDTTGAAPYASLVAQLQARMEADWGHGSTPVTPSASSEEAPPSSKTSKGTNRKSA